MSRWTVPISVYERFAHISFQYILHGLDITAIFLPTQFQIATTADVCKAHIKLALRCNKIDTNYIKASCHEIFCVIRINDVWIKISRRWSWNAVAAHSAEKWSPAFEMSPKFSPSPVLYNQLWAKMWNTNCPLNSSVGGLSPEKLLQLPFFLLPLLSLLSSSSRRWSVNMRKLRSLLTAKRYISVKISRYWLLYVVFFWSSTLQSTKMILIYLTVPIKLTANAFTCLILFNFLSDHSHPIYPKYY